MASLSQKMANLRPEFRNVCPNAGEPGDDEDVDVDGDLLRKNLPDADQGEVGEKWLQAERRLQKAFSDQTISGASSIYVSTKPLTTAMGRSYIFRSLIAFMGCYGVVDGVLLVLKVLDSMPTMVTLILHVAERWIIGYCFLAAGCVPRRHCMKMLGVGCGVFTLSSASQSILLCVAFSDYVWAAHFFFYTIDGCLLTYMCMNELFWKKTLFIVGLTCFIGDGICTFVQPEFKTHGDTILGRGYTYLMTFFMGFVLLSVLAALALYRRWALRTALKAVKPDQASYNQVWLEVLSGELQDLQALQSITREYQRGKTLQKINELPELFKTALGINQWYQDVVKMWANYCGATYRAAPLKSIERAQEKILRSYAGKVDELIDVVRATILGNTVADLAQVLKLVTREAIVHTIKNRYDTDYDENISAGYRDINLQLSFPETQQSPFDGFVFELQLLLTSYYELKADACHKRYITLRNLRGD